MEAKDTVMSYEQVEVIVGELEALGTKAEKVDLLRTELEGQAEVSFEAAHKQERAKWIPTNLVIVGVAYRFYPGGVECIITDQDVAGFNETKGFAKADTPEFYDRHALASKALLQALKGAPDED